MAQGSSYKEKVCTRSTCDGGMFTYEKTTGHFLRTARSLSFNKQRWLDDMFQIHRKETLPLNSNSPGITTECAGLCRDEVYWITTYFPATHFSSQKSFSCLFSYIYSKFPLLHDFKTQGADCPAFSIDYNGQRCFSLDRNTQVFEALQDLVFHILVFYAMEYLAFDATSPCIPGPRGRFGGEGRNKLLWEDLPQGQHWSVQRQSLASDLALNRLICSPLFEDDFLISSYFFQQKAGWLKHFSYSHSSRAFERVPGKRLEGFDNKIIEQVQILLKGPRYQNT